MYKSQATIRRARKLTMQKIAICAGLVLIHVAAIGAASVLYGA